MPRLRHDENPPLVSQCFLQFVEDEPDPEQHNKTVYKHSKEIKALFLHAPIAKDHRGTYIWLCQLQGPFYTMNPEDMTEGLEPSEDRSQNHCDICGRVCGRLHVFRAFEPCEGVAGMHPDRRRAT